MMFKTKSFSEDHYPSYSQWLIERGRVPSSFVNLPKTGFVVYDDEDDYAAGFLNDYGTKQCSFGSFASNPYADESKRSEAVGFLIDYLLDLAKNRGYEAVFMATNKKKLVDRLIQRDFTIYDSNLIQLGKVL